MKPYGVPRVPELDFLGTGDGHRFAVAGNKVNIPGRCGDIRSNFKNAKNKKRVRRYWKKKARRDNKVLVIFDY